MNAGDTLGYHNEITGRLEGFSELEKKICGRDSSELRLRITEPHLKFRVGDSVNCYFPRKFSNIEKEALLGLVVKHSYRYEATRDDNFDLLREYVFTIEVLEGHARGELYREECSDTVPYWLV